MRAARGRRWRWRRRRGRWPQRKRREAGGTLPPPVLAAGRRRWTPGKLKHFGRAGSGAPGDRPGQRCAEKIPAEVARLSPQAAPAPIWAKGNSLDLECQATLSGPSSHPLPSPPPATTRAPDRGVAAAGPEVAEIKWEGVWGAPTTAPAPLNKGEKPSPSRGDLRSKEKAKFNTYHCCSKSQSLKKSNRSIAAGRRRRAGVRPCSRRVGAALGAARSLLSAARLSGPPARLKVPRPHRRRRRAPGVPGPALRGGGGGGTGRASAQPPARVRSLRGCPRAQRPDAAAAGAGGSGRRGRPPGGLRAGGGGGGGRGGSGSGAARRGSRGGSGSGGGGGGGCTGGGGGGSGRGSITHLHTHRGRSLGSPKPRHGACTLSAPDLAGARRARLRRPGPPSVKISWWEQPQSRGLGPEPEEQLQGCGRGTRDPGSEKGTPPPNPRPLPPRELLLEPEKSALTAAGIGVDPPLPRDSPLAPEHWSKLWRARASPGPAAQSTRGREGEGGHLHRPRGAACPHPGRPGMPQCRARLRGAGRGAHLVGPRAPGPGFRRLRGEALATTPV